jgi:hypothetical protein
MCLTNSVHLIDFDNLDATQKKKLDTMHKKMKARRAVLKKTLDDLDAGIAKLEGKKKGSSRKTKR